MDDNGVVLNPRREKKTHGLMSQMLGIPGVAEYLNTLKAFRRSNNHKDRQSDADKERAIRKANLKRKIKIIKKEYAKSGDKTPVVIKDIISMLTKEYRSI